MCFSNVGTRSPRTGTHHYQACHIVPFSPSLTRSGRSYRSSNIATRFGLAYSIPQERWSRSSHWLQTSRPMSQQRPPRCLCQVPSLTRALNRRLRTTILQPLQQRLINLKLGLSQRIRPFYPAKFQPTTNLLHPLTKLRSRQTLMYSNLRNPLNLPKVKILIILSIKILRPQATSHLLLPKMKTLMIQSIKILRRKARCQPQQQFNWDSNQRIHPLQSL